MTERPWYTERGVIASAALLAVILVIGGVAVLSSGSGGDGQATPDARTRAAAPAARHVDTGGSMCGLPVGNTDKPVGPPDATWKLVGTVAVPNSPQFGPGVAQGIRRVCFAHSPTGALFAAASFLAVASSPDRDVKTLRAILAETHARNVLLRQSTEPSDPFARVQIAGFRVTVASRDMVVVDLALQTNKRGAIVAMSLPMRWEQRKEGGDWRFMITDPERPYVGAQIDDLRDYVRWSGA